MARRKVYDDEGHAQFVTFSCYHRRKWLSLDQPKRIVLGILGSQLTQQRGLCGGFVIMPDHVHAIVWFPEPRQLAILMKQWKQRSSFQIHEFFKRKHPAYLAQMGGVETVWQAKYYPFNIFTQKKLLEKLEYMHNNPVRAGLVSNSCDWPWSSARFYLQGKPVGIKVGLEFS